MKNFNHFESIGLDELDSLIPNNKINTSYFESIGLEPLFQEDGDSGIGETSLDAIGMSAAPMGHSQSASSIKECMEKLARRNGIKNLIIDRELSVTDNPNDMIPDVLAHDKRHEPRIIVEVTRNRSLWQEIAKAEIYRSRFPDAEIFIYEYETEENGEIEFVSRWHKMGEYKLQEHKCNYSDILRGELNVDRKTQKRIKDYCINRQKDGTLFRHLY